MNDMDYGIMDDMIHSDVEVEYDTEDEKRTNTCKYNKNDDNQTRKKRKNIYNKEWETNFCWLTKSSRKGNEYAKCIVCNTEFKISNGGKYDVKRHGETPKHTANNNAVKKSNIEQFLNPLGNSASDVEKRTIAAEATFVYHTVYHSQSYNSATCSSQLFTTIFEDSKVAGTFQLCDRK